MRQQTPIKAAQPVYNRVAAIKERLAAQYGRPVTFSEALEKMATVYEQTEQLISDVETS